MRARFYCRHQATRLVAWVLATVLGGLAMAANAADAPAESERGGVDFFERKIRPLLVVQCYECHSGDSQILKGGLRIDTRAGVFKGGDSGPAVVPAAPDDSPLVQAVRYDGLEMPPSGRLSADEIAAIETWVRAGAPMPPDTMEVPDAPASIDYAAGRKFWAFQPLNRPAVPEVSIPDGATSPVDAFVLAELKQHALQPSAEADRRTLFRRLSFDLIGLPPKPAEMEAFLSDASPDAYERLVERLLASPRYGERWGRHWLDLARYSDAQASWLDSIAQAWLYRDWVVRAFNEDLPYDVFVRRQLAADLAEDAEPRDIAALGFLGLSPVYWKELKLDPEVIKGTVAEEWEERVDAVGRTFLGLTIACARCHDHKFDPIGTADYYALAGVIANSRLIDRPVISGPAYATVRAARDEVASLKGELVKLEAMKPPTDNARTRIADVRRRMGEIEQNTPHFHDATAHAIDDAALLVEADGADATKLVYKPGEAFDLAIQIRGNPSRPGELAPRRFLQVLSSTEPRVLQHGSGRGDLAEAIVNEAGPLAARVMVNRMWRHHFGRGLVETPSDFGVQGSPPSHPELLEYLASRFIESGWSLKQLHREIVCSATYRQRSAGPEDAVARERAQAADPDNRLLWRANRRRLDIESWRDAVLAAAGSLDETIGGPPVELQEAANRRRTIYGRVDRYDLDPLLRLYDFPDPLGHSPGREPTTTPLQQLFVLNGPFVVQQAEALALRVCGTSPKDQAAQVRRAYEMLFARPASEAEMSLAAKFLSGETDGVAAWKRYAQVLIGSNESMFID